MTNLYILLMQAFGVFSVLVSGAVIAVEGIRQDEALLTLLGVTAGWLRFRLSPSGFVTLSPTAFFLALLIVQPWEAFVVAVASTVLGAVIFGRPRTALLETGEESVPPLVAVVTYSFAKSIPSLAPTLQIGVPYLSAVVAYTAAKFLLGITGAYVGEGIAFRSYLLGAGKNSVANLLLHATVALALRLFLFGQFGYFALILATIALVEFYHPWKLLSEQDAVLFANLAVVAQAIDVKDPYTARHSRNVAQIAVRIARAMGLPENEVRKIRIGALMHDIGKIGVSTAIIRKPTRLDPEEQRSMQAHPEISADIMQPIELLAEAAEIVRHHHEHCDGTGYPSRLKGEEIPIGSRVILVADAFDAMTTDRPYRRGRSKEEAVKVLRDHAGKQFDAEVVRALETIVGLL